MTNIQRAVLVIADIGGYTKYMNWNRMHLSHAQQTVASLLEAVIDASMKLKLAKLEGDAAFFWAPDGDANTVVCERLPQMRQAFLTRRERLKKDFPCHCEACTQRDNLSLKFVVHEGEVAEQKVKRNVELAGVDVILVHRMLKNTVPVPEYVLMTDVVAQQVGPCEFSTPLTQTFEDFGDLATTYIDLTDAEFTAQVQQRGFVGRHWAMLKFEVSTLPFRFGLRESCADFHNMERAASRRTLESAT